MKARIIANQKCNFILDGAIMKTLVFGLLFENLNSDSDEVDSAEVERAKQRVAKHFKYNEEDDVYVVENKSILKLNPSLLNNFVLVGVSFCQASRLYQSVKEETGMGVLGNVSDMEVTNHCRVVYAINLQYLKEIFKHIWAFFIAIDAGNNAGTAYLDLRMRCFFQGRFAQLLRHGHSNAGTPYRGISI